MKFKHETTLAYSLLLPILTIHDQFSNDQRLWLGRPQLPEPETKTQSRD